MDNGGGAGGVAKRAWIEGVVQGVGFRPFVYRAALACGVHGYVANMGGGVEVVAGGGDLARFLDTLRHDAPREAHIEWIDVVDAPMPDSGGFRILPGAERVGARFVSTDLTVCDDCLNEIFSGDERRGGHFFCSCVNCGPRFTVIRALPYDRQNTSMAGFPLCPDCDEEYTNPANRRFHAETTCCNDCGPTLSWLGEDGLTGGAAFNEAVKRLKDGGVVAVKGIGGYHLACSPFDAAAVAAIRRLKRREEKPFAVMFRDAGTALRYCEIDGEEERLLSSPPRPITLLRVKGDAFAPNTLNGDARCGAFLPYTPLHALLLREIPALVMTSANLSGSAIITDDGDAADLYRKAEEPLFRGVLGNDREILRAAEDSVAQVSLGRAQVLRRSRGYAPSPFRMGGGGAFFAAGGDLKAAFCLARDGYVYQSPYYGDLEDADVLARYQAAFADLSALFGVRPQAAVCDLHPGYFSAAFAESLGLPLTRVQHHHAHAASVMAEHGLTKAVAVCFDGTGYGDDGAVWGGEFLLVDTRGYARAGHLRYVDMPGGDALARDAAKTALCYQIAAGEEVGGVLAAAVKHRANTVRVSSAGRLFDAAAAVLGLRDMNRYEGQCAIALQQAAERGVAPVALDFAIDRADGLYLPNPAGIIQQLREQARNGANAADCALGFHHAVARMVAKVCAGIARDSGVKDIALTGGVFQNTLLAALCERCITEADGRLRVYMNELYPPNDNGIALGQVWVASRLGQ